MIKLKNLISIDEVVRSKYINKDIADKFIQRYCTTSLDRNKHGFKIYRGRNKNNGMNIQPHMIINPKQSERKSKNTSNIYTSLIDSSDRWKDYPKRSRSIIATTNKGYAYSYGMPYLVYLINGAKIGLCSSDDFWGSFKYIKDEFNIGNMEEFNGEVLRFFRNLNDVIGKNLIPNGLSNNISPNNINSILDKFQSELTEKILQTALLDYDITEFGEKFIDYLKKGGNIREFFDDILDPSKNKFRLTTIENFNFGSEYDMEIWTDAISVMVIDNEE